MDSIYRPLQENEIRIVSLEPGYLGSPVFCSLVYDHLDALESPFEALSYTWGDPTVTTDIVCNGTTAPVTQNLFSALQALRKADYHRLAWIDALSINQKDVHERNAQVRLMASIYQAARQVVIWLGEEDDDTSPAIDLLSKIVVGANTQPRADTKEALKHNVALAGVPTSTHPSWKSMTRLLERPWFSRIWVIQEAVMARQIIVTCGSFQMEWETLHQAADTLDMIDCTPGINGVNMRIMSLQRYHRRRSEKDLGLLRLLLNEKSQSATDDRDKIYALVGLATDIRTDQCLQGIQLVIDYDSDVRDVYIQLACSVITTYNSLSILTASGVPNAIGKHNLPSWVPDWSMPHSQKTLMDRVGEMTHATCNGRPADCRISANGGRLTVFGCLQDLVFETRRPLDKHPASPNDFVSILLEWNLLAQGEVYVPERLLAFRRTVITNRSPYGNGPPNEFDLLAFFEWFRVMMHFVGMEIPRAEMISPDGRYLEDTDAAFLHFNNLIWEACRGRRFFITRKGSIGICPSTTMSGDLVCIVRGACVPLILRAVKAETTEGADDLKQQHETYLYVGDAYVDGLMNGEGYEETAIREFEIQ
ncbi:hypothetical protein MMC18_004908 [Xylographa bjoerkii]|nr:hypothetical protein [Xylographa bjoerkii]